MIHFAGDGAAQYLYLLEVPVFAHRDCFSCPLGVRVFFLMIFSREHGLIMLETWQFLWTITFGIHLFSAQNPPSFIAVDI